VAQVAIIRSVNESLKFWHILWVRKVDDVDVDSISLETLAQLLASCLILFNWMSNEDDDPLLLVLVHAVLE